MVLEIMGLRLDIFEEERLKPFEIVAYALDYEAQGLSNPLSKAISERF